MRHAVQTVEQAPVNNALLNVVTPMGLSFEKNRLSIGENIGKAYGIIRYPQKVDVEWLSKLTNIPGTLVSIGFKPVDISPLITEMSEMLKEAEDKRKELLRQEILQMGGFALSGEIVERQFYIALWEKQEEGIERDLLKRASLLCEKFATGGVTCDILTEKEIVRLINLVNNPSYTHLEDAETAASIPVLKGVM